MNWIDVKKKLPENEGPKGVPVIVRLVHDKERVYGDVVFSVFFKGKFHWNFNKGAVQDVIEWMPLPPESLPKHCKWDLGTDAWDTCKDRFCLTGEECNYDKRIKNKANA